uniref:Protein kinase domain-containing protein n=1 Tax=Panagrolaimus sp. JU765 TaxID=591449 RepID=A0AC34RES3_9BILA
MNSNISREHWEYRQSEEEDEKYLFPPRYSTKKWEKMLDGKFSIEMVDKVAEKDVKVILHKVPYQKAKKYAEIVRELELSVKLYHKNIIVILNIFTPQLAAEDFCYFCVVYEHMDYTLDYLRSHRDWLKNQSGSTGAERLSFITYQMLCGIDYLHKAGIAHRDLRPNSILINKKCRIKLAHLGNARHFSEIAELPDAPEAARYWAPEIFNEIKKQTVEEFQKKGNLDNFKPKIAPNLASDIYAIGVILYEILGNIDLFPELQVLTENAVELITKRFKELPKTVGEEQFPEHKHPKLKQHKGHLMFQNMTIIDSKERHTARKLLGMDYVHWVRLEGDVTLPPGHCITVGIDKIDFSAEEWKENLFRMIKDYERTHDTDSWIPNLPDNSSVPVSSTEKK